jgi:hypothetical protein
MSVAKAWRTGVAAGLAPAWLLAGCGGPSAPPVDVQAHAEAEAQVAKDAPVAAAAPAARPAIRSAQKPAGLDPGDLLSDALAIDPRAENGYGLVDDAVDRLRASGAIGAEPEGGEAYSHVYLPHQPMALLGQQVLAIDHEYLETWAGCCVNYGLAVYLEGRPSPGVDGFARAHRCSLRDAADAYGAGYVQRMFDSAHAPLPDAYFELSCKEDQDYENMIDPRAEP